MKTTKPQKPAVWAVPSYLQAAYVPVATPVDIQTGSTVLDYSLAQSRARTGQVLYLAGGEREIQRAALLGFCKAACERGENSVFFDLLGTLDAQTIRRAGLLAYSNVRFPDDPNAPFRVLSPQTPVLLDAELKAITQSPGIPAPSVVVIEGLSELLERQYRNGSGKAKHTDIAKAARVLHNFILKTRLGVVDTQCTVWIAHTHSHVKNQARSRPTLSLKLANTIQNTLRNHASYEVNLGRATGPYNGISDFFVRACVRRYGTSLANPRRIVMDKDGRFKNA